MTLIAIILIIPLILSCDNSSDSPTVSDTVSLNDLEDNEVAEGPLLDYKLYLTGKDEMNEYPLNEVILDTRDKKSLDTWSSKMKTYPSDFCNKILYIYIPSTGQTKGFLGNNTNYVKSFLQEAVKNNSPHKDALGSQIISSHTNSDQDLMTSIVRRYPVYYGHAIKSRYNPNEVKKVLEYDVSDKDYMNKVNPDTRFALLGKAYINKDLKPLNPDYVYFIHIWGVNLETTHTDDYNKYVDKQTKRIKRLEYAVVVGRTVENMMNAALKVARSEANKEIYLRTPGVGLNSFLKSINNQDDKNFACRIFIEILAYLSDLPQFSKINIDFCQRNNLQNIELPPNVVSKLKKNDKNFRMIKNGNMYDLSGYQANQLAVLTNAWDNRSPVGNGGYEDPTLDGWTVSASGPGAKMPNTSFLHNYWFNREKRPISKYKSNIKDEFFVDIAKKMSSMK